MPSQLERLLKSWTGRGRRQWMWWIEDRIAFHSGTDKYDGKIMMKENTNWLRDLTEEVYHPSIVGPHRTGDGNMLAAQLISLILTLWFSRILRAKIYSENYPIKPRKGKHNVKMIYHAAMMEAMTDESLDHKYFPTKEFVSPFTSKKRKSAK